MTHIWPDSVGFTGTRRGLSPEQVAALRLLLQSYEPRRHGVEFHHGDCVGADATAAAIAAELRFWVVSHPPDVDRHRAFTQAREEFPPLPYLVRNRAIVDSSDLLVACPGGPERVRSGTWATVRYARARGVAVVLIHPSGATTLVAGTTC